MPRPAPESPDDAPARFISPFLESEREVLRYVLPLVLDGSEAREMVQSTAIELWRKFEDNDPERPSSPGMPFCLRQTQTQPDSQVPAEKKVNRRQEGIGRSDSQVLFVLVQE